MTARGMLFRPDLARAIREGAKTQTRRPALDRLNLETIIDVADLDPDEGLWSDVECGPDLLEGRPQHTFVAWHGQYPEHGPCMGLRPPHKPGDVVYVKEPWAVAAKHDYSSPRNMYRGMYWEIQWLADYPSLQHARLANATLGRYRNARFLRRDFARTWLRITDVRLERVCDISEADARAEGIGGPEAFLTAWSAMYRGTIWEDTGCWAWVYEWNPYVPLDNPDVELHAECRNCGSYDLVDGGGGSMDTMAGPVEFDRHWCRTCGSMWDD